MDGYLNTFVLKDRGSKRLGPKGGKLTGVGRSGGRRLPDFHAESGTRGGSKDFTFLYWIDIEFLFFTGLILLAETLSTEQQLFF